MSHTFATLQQLLRLTADAPEVFAVTQVPSGRLERFQHVSTHASRDEGLSFNFKEAPWVVPEFRGPRDTLVLRAIHFHSNGHEGHAGFNGTLLGGLRLGDDESTVVGKLGPPAETGGGKYSQLLKRDLPRWLRYFVGVDVFQVQLSKENTVELATLFVPEPPPRSRS